MTNAIRKLLSFLLVAVMMLSLVAPVLPEWKVSAAEAGNTTGDDLTVGVLTDIHVSDHFGEGVQLNRLKKALLFLRSQNVDAIVIAGDLQEYSSADQLETSKMYIGQLVAAWQEIFPAAKGEQGYVEPIFIYGNHDTNMTEAGWWPEEFGTFSAAYTKTVNGYTFVAANHHRTPQTAGPAAAAPLLENAVKANPDKPVFYIQHSWIGDTVPGWGYGDGEAAYARTMLAPYHNVVAITGHTHVPLTDEKSIWQGDGGNDGQFTVLNGATTNYSGLGHPDLTVNGFAGNANQTEHGMVMHVSGSDISVERYSFNDMTIEGGVISGDAVKIGETWAWDACDATDRPYAYDTRYETANAPVFGDGAAMTVNTVTDTSVSVSVPAASLTAPDGYSDMIEQYIVEACDPTTGKTEASGKIATSYHIDDKPDVYQLSYAVNVSGLKPGVNYTLKAYAVEFYGKRSAALTADITTTGERTYYRAGDINRDGNIDAGDMTALQEALAAPSAYNAAADVDGNGINETRDITALQAMLDGGVITYPDSDDLLDHVSRVTLTNVGTSADYQPVAYGTGIDTAVVNGDSNQSVKTWTTNRIGWANTTIYFDEPQDLSGYTHLSFDTLFENEYHLSDSYLKRFLGVTLISGYQEQKASVGSMNFDQGGKGWDTKTISLAGLKNIDLTAVTAIRFGHNFEYYEGRFDGVTEHAIYWDDLRGLVIEGSDADMLTSSTVSGGQNIYGAGYTNGTNVAIQSTGGSIDVIWTTPKVINDYAAFTVDMRTPVKATVQVQPIDAEGNVLGSAASVESCNIYQNKEILAPAFGLADGQTAAGLRFTYTCQSLLLDNMNARGAKDHDLIGTASRVEAVGGEKLTMTVTTEGTNHSNNAIYAYAMPQTSVWGGGAKLIFDEGLDLSQNHYLRYDIKIVNNHRDLYLKLYDTAGELIADYGTLRIHQSIGDGNGAYVTYEIDLLNSGTVTAEQLKNVGAIQLTSNMHSDSNYDSNGNVNNNAYNDPNAPRQIWIDNVYAVNPMEDALSAVSTLSGIYADRVEPEFVYEVLDEVDGRTDVLHYHADPENNGGTLQSEIGNTRLQIAAADIVKHNFTGYDTSAYDYFRFSLKNTGTWRSLSMYFYDAGGKQIGSTKEFMTTKESDWMDYRVDLATLGLTNESIGKIARIDIYINWKYQTSTHAEYSGKVADIYIDDIGFDSVNADNTDLLDTIVRTNHSGIINTNWFYSNHNIYPDVSYRFQSDLTIGSDSAYLIARSDWSKADGGYMPRERQLLFQNPITLDNNSYVHIDIQNVNFPTNYNYIDLIGSDGKVYTCFTLDKTGTYHLQTAVSDIVATDGTVLDTSAVTITGILVRTYFSKTTDSTKPGYLVFDNLTVGEQTEIPVVEESIADDWIKLPIDSGACYGTVSVDTEHTYGDSTQSLKYVPASSHYFAFNSEAAKNNGDLESIDLTGGTLSWYVYFGDQEAKGQICLGNGGTYTNEPYVTYTAVGDGWYHTEVTLSELTSAANVTPNVTRIYLYFPVGYTVWIDQLKFTPGQTEPEPTEPTEPEPTEPEPTEPPVDGGDMLGKATMEWNPDEWNGSKASYDSSSTTVSGENSEKSWKFYTTVDGTGSIGAQLKLNEYFDGTGKDLAFDILIDNAQNSMSIEMWNGWYTISNTKIPVNVYGSKTWQTIVLPAADIQAVYGDADMSQIYLIRFNMNLTAVDAAKERAIYIDNVRFVEPGTVSPYPTAKDGGDLLANSNNISYDDSHWTEETGLSWGVELDETFGEESWRSWRFEATADASLSNAVAQLNLNNSYDLTGAYLAYDVKLVSSDATDILAIGTRPDDAGWAAIANTITTNVAAGDWRTVVLDFNDLLVNDKDGNIQSMTDLSLVTFYFNFSTTTGAERTVYIDNLRIVPGVESYADDEIHMSVDPGSTGVKYWLSDRYTYGENSTVSMYMWADTTNNNGVSGKGTDMYYSPEAAKNTLLGGKLPDYSHGILTGYFYFGDQEPYATWQPMCNGGWTGMLGTSFGFKALGDGWYLGTVNAAWLSTNSKNSDWLNGEAIRAAINFKSGAKVYVDNLHFVENETVEQDWTNMSLDSGATKGTYRMDTDITYGTKASLYFHAATGTNLVLNPQTATSNQVARLSKCDVTNGTLTWYVYFGEQSASGSIILTDKSWKEAKTAVAYESVGNGWYKGTVDTTVLTCPDGYDSTQIIRIYLQFAQGGEYYVDQMTFTPHPIVLEDMIASSIAFQGPTAVQENFQSGILETTEDGRVNVAYAAAVTDNGLTNSNWPGELKVSFPAAADYVDTTVYDFLEFDYKNTGVKYALYVSIYDANGTKLGESGEIRATNICDWTTHRIDLTTMGLTADELKLAAQIWFSVSWEYNNAGGSKLQAGTVYFDNARFGSVAEDSDDLLDHVVRTKVNNGTANTNYTNAGAYFDSEGGYVLKRDTGSAGWVSQQLYFDAPITIAAGSAISADFINTGFHHGYSISLIGSDGKTYSSIAPNADGDQTRSIAIESFVSSGTAFDPATVTVVGIHISFCFATCHSNPDVYATLTIKHVTVTSPES